MKKLSTAKGFTLIELVVVIVILGILAATAAPKFIDLTGDAKQSVIEGVQGSVNSALNMVHAKALVANQTDATGEVNINGTFFALKYGYPTRVPADTKDNLAGTDPCGATGAGCGIEDLIQLDNETDITYNGTTGDFEYSGTSSCKVNYAEATSGTVIASTTLNVSSC